MKLKNFLFALLAPLMFISCSDEITTTEFQLPISFASNYIGSSTSRALGDIDNTNVKNSSFYVYGQLYDGTFATATNQTTIFDQQLVSNIGGKWGYSPTKYWDSEKKYTFTAVMPENISTTNITYTDDNRIKITNIPLTQPILDQDEVESGIDYLVSKSVDDCTSNSGTVYLQFKHLLSRFSVFVYTSDDDAEVTVNSMNIYLPNGTADYEEVNHNEPKSNVVNATDTKQEGDIWVWSGFNNKVDGVNDTYQKYSLLSKKTPSVSVPYYDGIPTVNDARLMPIEFFMAPIDKSKLAKKEDLQLYMDISFHVKYSDNIEQDIVRSMPIKIQDLHSFTQNYKTNLFIKLLSEEDIISFKVAVEDYENSTNHWVDHYGYSFNLVSYSQTLGIPTMEISGILDDFGNVAQGDSNSELSYSLVNLYPINGSEGDNVLSESKLLDFTDGWDSTENGSFGKPHITNNRYGKFTINLDGENITEGDYWMVIKNTMNDTRTYKIRLIPGASMAFTIDVNSKDKYTIPFVTYETAKGYWDETQKVGGYTIEKILNAMHWSNGSVDASKSLCFSYPSDLIIDWGDWTPMTFINEGDICEDSDVLTHMYSASGKYQIRIFSSETDFTKDQIPQINWGVRSISYNVNASANNGNGYTDSKIYSIDTPILKIYDAWAYLTITFDCDPLAAGRPWVYPNEGNGNLYPYELMTSIFYNRFTNSKFNIKRSKPSVITAMFHNSSLTKMCNNVFIYNGKGGKNFDELANGFTPLASGADWVFLLCEKLENIGSGIFDDCPYIQTMMSTFQGDNMKIKIIPDGLFKDQTEDIYFYQTFIGCPLTYIPLDLFSHCGSGSQYVNIGFKADDYK